MALILYFTFICIFILKNKLFKNIILPYVISRSGVIFLKQLMIKQIVVALLCVNALFYGSAEGAIRIKDVVNFEGVRDNHISGYGLVVGLSGSGDALSNSGFTEKTLRAHLNRLGIGGSDIESSLKTKNVAAVMVTANLLPFARNGSRLSVVVSTMGDAKSLKGGVLLATPLKGADGNVYAVAQGAVSIGSLADNEIAQKSRQITTNGFIMNGAIVEREVDFSMNRMKRIKLALKNPDISTARAITTAINSKASATIAKAEDPGTIDVTPGKKYHNNMVQFLAEIENLHIKPDQVAKIVIDESSGTIVFGEHVRISKVAISQGDLIIRVMDDDFSLGIGDKMEDKKVFTMNPSSNLGDLVKGLNTIGVKTSELISILKAIQQAGALQAEIEIRRQG